jgi:coronin-7
LDIFHSADAQKSGKPLLTVSASNPVDFDFSSFEDDLLAVGSEDGRCTVWRVDDHAATSNCVTSLDAFQRRIEAIAFHPTASHLVTAASYQQIAIWDVEHGAKPAFMISGHTDQVQSFSWKDDGSLLASTARDSVLRIWDPRNSATEAKMSGKSHDGNKASRVVWLGSKDYVFTTGFSQMRQREYALFDVRAGLTKPLFRTQLESSSSLLLPLYDQDTDIIYLVGRGDTSVKWLDVNTACPSPTMVEGAPAYLGDSISGAVLVPKRCLNIMEAEIARILCLTKDHIMPG